MSGYSNNCIVCNRRVYAIYGGVTMSIQGVPAIACRSCVPYAPKLVNLMCKECGAFGATFTQEEEIDWTCDKCKKSLDLVEHYKKLRPQDTL